jgi:hypothetical protein
MSPARRSDGRDPRFPRCAVPGAAETWRRVISVRQRAGQGVGRANGFWIWTILAIIVWIAIAFWPARVAGRKGHSFFGYFLFSLVFFPAALIVAYLVSDRTAGGQAAPA